MGLGRAFKVVKVLDDGRRISAWLGYLTRYKYQTLFCANDKIFNYIMTYKQGEYVTAVKNSLGIMCFAKHGDAKYWKDSFSESYRYDIIEVLYHCKVVKPEKIINPNLLFSLIDQNVNDIQEHQLGHVMKGTICLKKIYCLT